MNQRLIGSDDTTLLDPGTTPPSILIIAERNDAHALAVATILREQWGCDPPIVAMSEFPAAQSATFGCGGGGAQYQARVGDVDLQAMDAVWWRRPAACVTPPDYFLFDKDFVQVECDHFLEGLLWSTPCAWVNHPIDERRAARKIYQLRHAATVGLRLPKTLITSDAACAEAFVTGFEGALITKRVGTSRGMATRTTLLSREDLSRLHTVTSCPTTLQEYIEPGGDVRVIAFGPTLHAFWIDSAAGEEPVDSRLDLSVDHRPYEMPEWLAAQLRLLLARLGLLSGVIDLRVSKEGRFYFLEVNPSGQYLYLELMTGVPLSRAMAELLVAAARGKVDGHRDLHDPVRLRG